MSPNPKYPIYIVSKGRWESRLTIKALEKMKVPFNVVVEPDEVKKYLEVVKGGRVLKLDMKYKEKYDTCDKLGDKIGKGSGGARNFAWDHSIKEGHKRHWVIDDNILSFYRRNKNIHHRVLDGNLFKIMEQFVDRYENVAMAGPNYLFFVPQRSKLPVFYINTRIYSCNLIDNKVPFRWRGRFNEDTDLSIRMLKEGYCTILFNAFLQGKMSTLTMKGGNTDSIYIRDGVFKKAEMIAKLHPDIARMTHRFKRVHHYVNYSVFKKNVLIRKKGIKLDRKSNEHGMVLKGK